MPCRNGYRRKAIISRWPELDPKEAFPVGLGTGETHHDRPFGSKLRMRRFDPKETFDPPSHVSANRSFEDEAAGFSCEAGCADFAPAEGRGRTRQERATTLSSSAIARLPRYP
jgi:hypothetical protein